MLSLHRLWILRQVDAHGGVGSAAAALGYTPSAVSQQLRALERETGVALVEKHGRGIRLSPAGRSVLPHVEAALLALARAEAELASQRAVVAGTVRLGVFPTFARALLPGILGALRDRHSRLVVDVQQEEPTEGLRALEAGARDVVVVYAYDLVAPAATGVNMYELFTEPILLVSSATSAAVGEDAESGPVELSSLADAPWILPPAGTACHDMVVRACGRAGFEPRSVGRTGDFDVVCALAAAGHGVGLVPALGLDSRIEGLAAAPTVAPLARRVFAATRPGNREHPHIAAVLAALGDATA